MSGTVLFQVYFYFVSEAIFHFSVSYSFLEPQKSEDNLM